MKRTIFSLAALLTLSAGLPANAITVAHWRFEDGPVNTNVLHTGAPGTFDGTITDVSGNGNHLSVWEQGAGAGYAYRSSVPGSEVPILNVPNNFSVKNTGGGPAMFTTSSVSAPTGVDIETMTPTAFTVEASWKPETGGHRTVVGRDAQNVTTGGGPLAAFYLQARPDNSIGALFVDLAGNVHEAFSPANYIQGFNFGSDNEGVTGTWYNLAAVSDGSTLKMYVNNALVASTPFTTADAGLAIGTTNGGDWHAGEWSVGRGLFNGGHTDRGYGLIDEVRISNSALLPTEFLFPAALSLEVNRSTGAVTMKNNAAVAVEVDFYSIASQGSALSLANWNSLDDQNIDAVDGPDGDLIAGNSDGEGWDEAGGSTVQQLVEQFLGSGGASIAANETMSLGNAYNTSVFGSAVDGDLAFTYSFNGGTVLTGAVTYVGGGGIPGDFNNSGKVDGTDFVVWQRGVGGVHNAGTLTTWKNNYGNPPVEPVAAAVPEPSTLGLLLVAGVAAGMRRRVG